MKRFVEAVLFCLIIGSFIASCATALPEHQRGAATKMGKPRQAQEEVAPPQTQGEIPPKDSSSQSK